MLAKYWKKIGMIIVIIACVFNVMIKLINKLSLDKEMLSSAQYVYDNQLEEENKNKQKENQNKEEVKQNNSKNTEQNNTKKQK